MATAIDSSPISDELAALRFTFEELLRIRAHLSAKRDQTKRFRRADRRIRRAHAAIQKQLQGLAVDLHAMGVSSMELMRMMDDASQSAFPGEN